MSKSKANSAEKILIVLKCCGKPLPFEGTNLAPYFRDERRKKLLQPGKTLIIDLYPNGSFRKKILKKLTIKRLKNIINMYFNPKRINVFKHILC